MLVAGAFSNDQEAPAIYTEAPEIFSAPNIQQWLSEARKVDSTDPTFQRGFLMLEQLLIASSPEETNLLPNYPNPFNPETWIPYQLATDTNVQILIYDPRGILVRRLELGYQPRGHYTGRSRAAYWDGRNGLGEPVASGIYFYQLQADEIFLTRKMVILK